MPKFWISAKFVPLADIDTERCYYSGARLGVEVEALDGKTARAIAKIPHSAANLAEVPGTRSVDPIPDYAEIKAELARDEKAVTPPSRFSGWEHEDDEISCETRGGFEFFIHGYFDGEPGGGDGWNEPRYGPSAWLGLACNPRTGKPCPRRTFWVRHPANSAAVRHMEEAACERMCERDEYGGY